VVPLLSAAHHPIKINVQSWQRHFGGVDSSSDAATAALIRWHNADESFVPN